MLALKAACVEFYSADESPFIPSPTGGYLLVLEKAQPLIVGKLLCLVCFPSISTEGGVGDANVLKTRIGGRRGGDGRKLQSLRPPVCTHSATIMRVVSSNHSTMHLHQPALCMCQRHSLFGTLPDKCSVGPVPCCLQITTGCIRASRASQGQLHLAARWWRKSLWPRITGFTRSRGRQSRQCWSGLTSNYPSASLCGCFTRYVLSFQQRVC